MVSFHSPTNHPSTQKSNLDPIDVNSYRPICNLYSHFKTSSKAGSQTAGITFESPRSIAENAVRLSLPSLNRDSRDQGPIRHPHCYRQERLRHPIALLGLTAAFDMVDHEILLQRLHSCFGVTGRVLSWIRSYLYHRTQFVRLESRRFCLRLVPSRVPQGSVLESILFLIYTADLLRVIERHGFHLHLYDDDIQVYDSCSLSSTDQLQCRLSDCIDDVACWMQCNRLNTQKNRRFVVHLKTTPVSTAFRSDTHRL